MLGAQSEHARRSTLLAIAVAARPRQWLKNLLVFIAPLAAGRLDEWSVVWQTVAAFALFGIVASGTYLINDVVDVDKDRRHPAKRNRPVASGRVGIGVAARLGVAALVGGTAASLAVDWKLTVVLGTYAALTTAYTLRLKHIRYLELVVLAAGFALRIIAGGAATDIPLSPWLVVGVAAGAGMVAAGKRSADQRGYHQAALTWVRRGAIAVVVATYFGWALDRGGGLYLATSLPVLVALWRFDTHAARGRAAAPEDLAVGDPWLVIAGIVWTALFTVAVYA